MFGWRPLINIPRINSENSPATERKVVIFFVFALKLKSDCVSQFKSKLTKMAFFTSCSVNLLNQKLTNATNYNECSAIEWQEESESVNLCREMGEIVRTAVYV